MKRFICILMAIMLFIGIAMPITVNADEGFTVSIELQVDPRIKADGVPVMVGFINVDTGKEYKVSITKDKNYWGEIKSLPNGTYSLVDGAVGSDWDGIYDFPWFTEYVVNGINTTWTIQVGDVNYDGPVNDKEDEDIKDPGFVDYEDMYGMTEEEYKEYLEKIEAEQNQNQDKDDLTLEKDYHKIVLDGNLTADSIILSFFDGKETRKITFNQSDEFVAEVIIAEGEYEVEFFYAKGKNEYEVVTEKITVVDDKGEIKISLLGKSQEIEDNENNNEITNPSNPDIPDEPGDLETPAEDERPITIWTVLIFGAGAAIGGVIIYLRRKNNEFEDEPVQEQPKEDKPDEE